MGFIKFLIEFIMCFLTILYDLSICIRVALSLIWVKITHLNIAVVLAVPGMTFFLIITNLIMTSIFLTLLRKDDLVLVMVIGLIALLNDLISLFCIIDI